MSRSVDMVQYRYFQSVIGPLIGVLHRKSSILFIIFNLRFNRALISRSGATVQHRYFQSVIASLTKGLRPLKQHFI